VKLIIICIQHKCLEQVTPYGIYCEYMYVRFMGIFNHVFFHMQGFETSGNACLYCVHMYIAYLFLKKA